MKNIPGFNLYSCTEDGRIFSSRKGSTKEIIGSPDKDGYLKITLVDNNGKFKYFRKHRLIMLTFSGYSELEVNHKDGNKLNNQISNLEYVSLQENQCHRRLKEGHKVGVCWAKKENKWRAYIQHNKKWEHLGFFINEIDAKKAYITRLNELLITNKYAKNS